MKIRQTRDKANTKKKSYKLLTQGRGPAFLPVPQGSDR